MKLTQFVPIPLIVAIFAFAWMVIAAQFNLLGWVAFVTWGGYFLTGVTTKSAVRELIAYSLGILAGVMIVILAMNVGTPFGGYTLPVIVGVAAFIIVLLELVPWFDMAPMYFLGAAVFFAAGAKPDVQTIMATWIPGILGLVLGIVVARIRGQVFKMEGLKDPLSK
ncbi:MAG: hypothetical protein UT38_C0010G0005 [Microgenomates group bacterium GW2011_GWA2_39_19]|nr:MAG: hypothetical protein UT38_C0010G0005 [Microgenomates group bacterium GW2011_GWA2_39_19]